jgi:hypothetical protein
VRRLRGKHIEVRWTMPSFERSLGAHTEPTTVEEVVHDAVRLRVRASQARAERALRGLGIRARGVEPRHPPRGERP